MPTPVTAHGQGWKRLRLCVADETPDGLHPGLTSHCAFRISGCGALRARTAAANRTVTDVLQIQPSAGGGRHARAMHRLWCCRRQGSVAETQWIGCDREDVTIILSGRTGWSDRADKNCQRLKQPPAWRPADVIRVAERLVAEERLRRQCYRLDCYR